LELSLSLLLSSLSLSLSLRFVWKDELNLFISSTRERTKF
jgi:hypothetical protein